MTPRTLTTTVPRDLAGERLDRALTLLFEDFSRNTVQRWIKDGAVRVDDRLAQQVRTRVAGGERVLVQVPEEERVDDPPQAIALDIRFEDEHLLVVNKPPGLVVHPGAGNPTGTLLNALLHHHPPLSQLPRAGLVHRIDKNTSGLLVVAKTTRAQTRLSERIAAHGVDRHYCAVVHGQPALSGTIDAPIARHPRLRTRMAVRHGGRASITHYRVERRFTHHTQLELRLRTGRTHQIRVHLLHLGFPIVGDREYGGIRPPRAEASPALALALTDFQRQALHAHCLAFEHPESAEALQFSAELPPDMAALMRHLGAETAPPR